jgi:hypothetical protein
VEKTLIQLNYHQEIGCGFVLCIKTGWFIPA